MKRSTPPLERHQHCQVEIERCSSAVHFAKIRCIEHNVTVCWLSRKQYANAVEQGLVKESKNNISKLFDVGS
jgi:hypothetical protein